MDIEKEIDNVDYERVLKENNNTLFNIYLIDYSLLFIIIVYFIYYYKLNYNIKFPSEKIKNTEKTKYNIIDNIIDNTNYISYLNEDDKYIVFNFIGTDKKYIINWKDYEFMSDSFFSNLVKYSEDKIINYNTNEDYELVKSIFQSIKYRKIIISEEIYNKTNLNNIVNILDKWSISDNILNTYIKDKINEYKYREIQEEYIQENIKLLSSEKASYLTYVFKCELCGAGFTELTNHKNACKYHNRNYNFNVNKWGCCGNSIDNKGCNIGYHKKNICIDDINNIKLINNLSN